MRWNSLRSGVPLVNGLSDIHGLENEKGEWTGGENDEKGQDSSTTAKKNKPYHKNKTVIPGRVGLSCLNVICVDK